MELLEQKIIELNHPGKTLKGALEEEAKIKGCEVHYSNLDGVAGEFVVKYEGIEPVYNSKNIDAYEILGLPCTLSRVLVALGNKYSYFNSLPNLLFAKAEEFNLLGEWNLTKNDTLLQSEETRDKLLELLK